MKVNEQKEGAIYAALSYMMWGIVPIYWKFLQGVGATEILAQRVLWSFVFMLVLLMFMRKWQAFVDYFKHIVRNPKLFAALLTASLLVTANWGVFIWAVNSGKILDTSLGYYINPLVSVLLGVIVLKEKLSGAQVMSFVLAGIGVLILGIHFGTIPWVSLVLAMTFGLYGLAKKMIKAESAIGLTLETMMVTPLALGYLIYLSTEADIQFFTNGSTGLLLVGGGIVTALPLLYFAKGAEKIPLSMLGIFQYIAPTLSLLIGVFVYHESFTKAHLLAFLFIWSALAVYTLSITKWGQASARRLKGKRNLGA
ncbi:EamA family transporter RarD [Peribacillus muralis]|uniref:EamA family transporter RarD n=1 Tax=Peribacillus muralis TaxID=264697 RepID=UPI001F4D73BB|nr:EamA family transporter RarD [Peribacillus muralis]MCK1991862.1 EamA family transporter RarD [Peribacillus muralis]MCK2012420.1 EamA family transporter RarD [Peribacillus muralis]